MPAPAAAAFYRRGSKAIEQKAAKVAKKIRKAKTNCDTAKGMSQQLP
jgi:hypothetical protein